MFSMSATGIDRGTTFDLFFVLARQYRWGDGRSKTYGVTHAKKIFIEERLVDTWFVLEQSSERRKWADNFM